VRAIPCAVLVWATLAISSAVPQPAEPAWRTLTNRGGWSIEYPPLWQVSSCTNCPDPTAPEVYVSFSLPSSPASSVMVEPLADRPAGQSVDAWLEEIKRSNNLNPIDTESSTTVNGLPGLRVRYRHSSGCQIEETYLVAGSKTYAISLACQELAKKDEGIANYPLYQHMVETFKAQGSR
jgi:hypothetical protein